jgi:hypothetical protein
MYQVAAGLRVAGSARAALRRSGRSAPERSRALPWLSRWRGGCPWASGSRPAAACGVQAGGFTSSATTCQVPCQGRIAGTERIFAAYRRASRVGVSPYTQAATPSAQGLSAGRAASISAQARAGLVCKRGSFWPGGRPLAGQDGRTPSGTGRVPSAPWLVPRTTPVAVWPRLPRDGVAANALACPRGGRRSQR